MAPDPSVASTEDGTVGRGNGRDGSVPPNGSSGPPPVDDRVLTAPSPLTAVPSTPRRVAVPELPPEVELQPPRRGKVKRKARRVRRIVRRVELWSVLKISLLFYACMYAALLGAVAGLWALANSTGLVDNFESFMRDVGFDNWQFYGDRMFAQSAVIGAILVITGCLLTVLGAALFNVISELTGGVRFVVLEEEPTPAPADTES